MRFSIVLNLLCTVAFSANSFSQGQNFSVNLENAKVKDVFRSLEGQSTYRFFYNDELSDINRVVSMDVKDSKIEDVLNELFSNTDVSYTILENNLIVIAPKRAVQQQKVSGIVTDALTGEPLIGVSILIEGTTTGAITDVNGKFSLDAPQNAVLAFSFIGYLTQKVTVSGQTTLDIKLASDATKLDEVVVVGYGTQKKSDITGAITSVSVSKLRDVPASNISKALQGKTAGVEIQNMGNRPGGSTQIRIRGSRSLTASNDPLIILDGIPFSGTLNDIASDDIASLEVLKDASATVIYGSRGANGVIIVTTKHGEPGKMKITYNGYTGVTNVARKYKVYNAEELVKYRAVAGYNAYLPDEIESMQIGRETDWQDLMYQSGITANHELGISGGTDKAQYSFSGGYYNETGVLPGIGFKRYSLKMTIDQQINKRIKVGLSTYNSYQIQEGQSVNPMFQIVTMSPLVKAYNNDGTINERPPYPTDEYYNPLALKLTDRWSETNRRFASFNTLYAEVQLFDGLKYKLNTGFNFTQGKYDHYYGSNTPMRNGTQNEAIVSNTDNIDYTIENMLIYDKTIAKKHRILFTGMFSVEESLSTGSQMRGTDIPADYLQYNNMTTAGTSIAYNNINPAQDNNYYTDWELVSFMGRLNYAYDDKYLVTLTARTDGSSRLAPGNKWHAYPAVALGWNVTKESFLQNQNVLSNLKLRFGYGVAANASVNPYSTLGSLSGSVYNFGGTGAKGYSINTIPNPNLGWESTETYNYGIDFGFIKGRLSGSIEYYQQKTKDLLMGVALPPSWGIQGQFMKNVGETKNKGIEMSLNAVIILPEKEGGFRWELSGNLFLNRDEITSLSNPTATRDVAANWFIGKPQSVVYDYIKLGIWQLGEETQAASYGSAVGKIKLKDTNGDGRITTDDRAFLGSSLPDCQGGFTSSFEFKGFDLSVVGYYKIGGMIASTLHMPNNYVNRMDGRRNGLKVDYWSPTNPTNDFPKPDASIDATNTNVLGYFDGSFLKIRSINLGYKINKNWTRFLGAGSSVRIYASVADPFIFFSPYIDKGGVDPEPTSDANNNGNNGSLNLPGRTLVVGLGLPPTTKYIFGINVKF